MSDDVIQQMDKEIAEEEKKGTGGPTMQPPGSEPPANPEEYAPEDNTIDDNSTETKTPMLDAEVERYSSLINRR
jgi:hypothetical protein